MIFDDTIAAISTPRGVGAIAVVRLSGPQAFDIADRVFKGTKSVREMDHARAVHGYVCAADGETIDEVVLTKFKGPHSYTGEDVVELSCHGGLYVVQEVLDRLVESGARLAEPGEFTRRAFVNGKMDLLQAESVADIINAQTRQSLRLSSIQLSGRVSEKLGELRESLKRQCMLLEVELDFSEEDIEFAEREELIRDVDNLLIRIREMLKSFKYGKILREGTHTVIVGKPNVGKSSILNRLLEEDRAIVSHVPGTTRDSLEESLDIDGVLFRITDTAGLRDPQDIVESEGVKRTVRLIENAQIILFVLDATTEPEPSEVERIKEFKSSEEQHLIVAFNKMDIADADAVGRWERMIDMDGALRISAKNGQGFADLEKALVRAAIGDQPPSLDFVINKVRHRDALQRALESLENARASLQKDLPSEFIALDLRGALDAIGELTGQVTREEILNDIFSGFCIGK